jgi:hypothetical protein
VRLDANARADSAIAALGEIELRELVQRSARERSSGGVLVDPLTEVQQSDQRLQLVGRREPVASRDRLRG